MLVSGFSVVALPEANFSDDSVVELFQKAPQHNGVYYAGFQRKEFGRMDEMYRSGWLPDDIREMYSRVRENRNLGLYDYYVTSSFEDALIMNNYLESLGERLEIIGLHSEKLENVLGCREIMSGWSRIGYDVNGDGYSMVLTCFFEKNELFNEEIIFMNKCGLLDDVMSAKILIEKYLRIQEVENIEKIDGNNIDILAVYRCDVPPGVPPGCPAAIC